MTMTEREFDLINKALPGATPNGAYSLGILTWIAKEKGFELTEIAVAGAVRCGTVREAVEYARTWVARRELERRAEKDVAS